MVKKILPLLILGVVILGAWYFVTTSQAPQIPVSKLPAKEAQSTTSQNSNAENKNSQSSTGVGADNATAAQDGKQITDDDKEGFEDTRQQPAAEVYKSAEEALKAVKTGAVDYDDIILEQFVEPGEDCTWCPAFYQSVKELLTAADTKPDQKSYYAELLAISGSPENIATLIDAIKNAPSQEEADLFVEALELTSGKGDIAKYLGDQLSTDNQSLKEALIAALTNQGSRLAAEILYKHTVEEGNPDGYYSLGIGLGEFVPDDEALPYLQEIALKRDQYSHLAIKALLNNGLNGLKLAMDIIGNSKDADFDQQMLKGAKDHVVFEEEVEAFLKKTLESSKQPVVVNFAKSILDDFKVEENEDNNSADDEDEDEAKQ